MVALVSRSPSLLSDFSHGLREIKRKNKKKMVPKISNLNTQKITITEKQMNLVCILNNKNGSFTYIILSQMT